MDSRTKASKSLAPAFKFVSELKGGDSSCLQDQFHKLHEILIDCEKHVFINMEGLRRKMDSVKDVCAMLEDDNQVSEIEKCRIRNDLVKSQKECEVMKEELERSTHRIAQSHEEQCRIADERNRLVHELEKSEKECRGLKDQLEIFNRIAKYREEQSAVTDEKNKVIADLKEKVAKLEIQLQDSEFLCEHISATCQEEVKKSKEKADKIVEELRQKELEVEKLKRNYDLTIERMRYNQVEDGKIIDKLRRKEKEGRMDVVELSRMQEKQGEDEKLIIELKHKEKEARDKVEELERRNTEASRAVEEMKCRQIKDAKVMMELWSKKEEDTKTMMELLRKQEDLEKTITELRRKEAEGAKKVEQLMQQNMETSEAVDELKRNKVEDEKLISELRHRETEGSDKFEQLRRQNIATSLAYDAMKQRQSDCEKVIVELKRKQLEDKETITDLRRKEAESNNKVKQLRQHMVTPRSVECMRCKDTENIHLERRRKEVQAHHKYAELKQRNYEASRTVAQLELEKLEAARSKTEMENQLMEKEKLLGTCQQKLKVLSGKVALTEKELHDVKGQKLDADKLIEVLRQNQTKSDETAEELRCQYLEASEKLKQLVSNVETENFKSEETLQDMRHKQSQVQQTVEELRCLIKDANQDVLPELKMLAEGLIISLEAEVQDLANVVLKEGSSDISPVAEGEKQTSGDSSLGGVRDTDVGIIATTATRVCQDVNSTEPACSESQNTVVDRRDEASLGNSACISGLAAVFGEKRKFSLLSSSSHSVPLLNFTPRRKRSSRANGNFRNVRQKRNQIQISTGERGDSLSSELSGRPNPGSTVAVAQAVSPTGSNPVLKSCKENSVADQICNVDSSSDHEDSDSDDDSCSESSINDLLASLRIRKLSKTWMSQADMLRDFQEDVDHCMNAVCVLHRQKISIPGSSSGSNGRFSRFDAMGGSALAEYLIDGDLKYRLRKTVSDTKEQRPDVLAQCRAIAMDHGEKLYSIYCNRQDPFFRSR